MRRVLIVIAVMVLSACQVDTTIDISMHSDGSGTITLTAIADADIVTKAPGLAEDLRFDDAKTAGWTVDGPTKTSSGGLQGRAAHDFANPEEATALLQSINGSGGPLHDVTVTRTVNPDGTTIELVGSLRIDGLAAFADPDVLAAIGATPYADQVATAGEGPRQAVVVTVRAASLPGKINSGQARSRTAACRGSCRSTVRSSTLPRRGRRSRLHQDLGPRIECRPGRPAGVVCDAGAFIAWVAAQRKRRAQRRSPRAV